MLQSGKIREVSGKRNGKRETNLSEIPQSGKFWEVSRKFSRKGCEHCKSRCYSIPSVSSTPYSSNLVHVFTGSKKLGNGKLQMMFSSQAMSIKTSNSEYQKEISELRVELERKNNEIRSFSDGDKVRSIFIDRFIGAYFRAYRLIQSVPNHVLMLCLYIEYPHNDSGVLI